MTLRPLTIDADPSEAIFATPDCQDLFKVYPGYYGTAGYDPPWIAYLLVGDGAEAGEGEVMGVASFLAKPVDGRVEIAYMTFKAYEGQGVASFGCAQLLLIARQGAPGVVVTAKTMPEENASTKILRRNEFVFTRVVQDDEIGDAWEWVWRGDVGR